MSSFILKNITNNLINIPGWRTNRKIVVIEADDWGTIRMPSKDIYNQLLKEGYRPNTDPFLKYDSLASEEDLSLLFDMLSSVKDKNGNPAVITANCVLANPDFDKIKQSGFTQYFYEPFTVTLKKYPNHKKSFELWQEGIEKKIFYPQCHGREHLNVSRWMKALQNGDTVLHKAFELKMISISSMPSEMRFGYMESLDYFTEEEKNEKGYIIKEGLDLFEKIFGYKSKSFISSCYIWGSYLEEILNKSGVCFIQGIANQIEPCIKGNQIHSYRYIKHYTGQKNKYEQRYLIRNAFFEPKENEKNNYIDFCLHRIQNAFNWKKPAIIGTHRLYFIGSIDLANRDRNLRLFRTLITKMLEKWPDIEFMTTDQLGDLILESTKN